MAELDLDQLKLSVEALSGGKNTIIRDNTNGMPSFMVRIPQLKYSDVITGGTSDVLPAFIVDGTALDFVHFSKYQNVVINNRAYSLPDRDPAVSLNFDTAIAYCKNKGDGWHLQTNALWAAVALWCKKNGTQPRGNNNYGQDISTAHEKGVPSMARDGSNRVQRTYTGGNGNNAWYHDYNSVTGIADMNGNINEWCGGLRLYNGEIQIIPDGNAMKANCDMSASSVEWKAVLQDGSLVTPGTADTLKWDFVSNNITLSKVITSQVDTVRHIVFASIGLASGITAPALFKALGLHPMETSGYESDIATINNIGERLPFRGGSFAYGVDAGLFALFMQNLRSISVSTLGFRAAYYGNV